MGISRPFRWLLLVFDSYSNPFPMSACWLFSTSFYGIHVFHSAFSTNYDNSFHWANELFSLLHSSCFNTHSSIYLIWPNSCTKSYFQSHRSLRMRCGKEKGKTSQTHTHSHLHCHGKLHLEKIHSSVIWLCGELCDDGRNYFFSCKMFSGDKCRTKFFGCQIF